MKKRAKLSAKPPAKEKVWTFRPDEKLKREVAELLETLPPNFGGGKIDRTQLITEALRTYVAAAKSKLASGPANS